MEGDARAINYYMVVRNLLKIMQVMQIKWELVSKIIAANFAKTKTKS